ncbi:copper resistance CopC family protein [Virgibacillus flavescens]|uniref:copper resistance CopC family protein n=1 Tax=Virgibacillus flavescens TaxID=1611422 RepID=UPI003D335E18
MVKIKMSFLLCAAMVLTLIIPAVANAHSGLENATPEAGSTIKEEIKTVELDFNTKVENGSSLFLINDEGTKFEPKILEINDDVIKGTFQDSINPGTYKVNWNIVGADGHPIEGTYSFTVTGSKKDDTSNQDEQTTTDEDQSSPDKQNASEERSSTDNNEPFINGIIIFLVGATLVLVAWLVFSKRKK